MTTHQARDIILSEIAIMRENRRVSPSPEGDLAMEELNRALITLSLTEEMIQGHIADNVTIKRLQKENKRLRTKLSCAKLLVNASY